MKKTRLLQTNRKALAGGEVREAKTGEFNPLSPKSDQYPVADLDFQIRGGPVSKNFFRPFGPQFGLRIRGGWGPPGPSPGSATDINFLLTIPTDYQEKSL